MKRNFEKDIYFQLVLDDETLAKSKVKKKIASSKTLDIMLDCDIEERMPLLQVYETKKLLTRNKLLHQVELETFGVTEDNVPGDLSFTFLNLKISGTFVIMVSRSSTSNQNPPSYESLDHVDHVESFEMVKRKGYRCRG